MGYIISPGMGWNNLKQLWNDTVSWLDKATKHGTWTENDQKLFDFSYGHNWMIDLYKGQYQREHYMRDNNLDWGDVTQPWNLPGSSGYSVAGNFTTYALHYVSDNIRKLYK